MANTLNTSRTINIKFDKPHNKKIYTIHRSIEDFIEYFFPSGLSYNVVGDVGDVGDNTKHDIFVANNQRLNPSYSLLHKLSIGAN